MKTHKLTSEENSDVGAFRCAIEFADGETDMVYGETREHVIVLAGQAIQQHTTPSIQSKLLGFR